jgi:hypothetical protein
MERLTTRNIAGVAVYKHPFECERCGEEIWRLPDYGNGSPTEKLAAYEDAEEQGLLLRLPCKVGDKIFLDFAGFGKDIDKFTVKDFHLDCFEDGETILYCDYESNDKTLSGQIDVMEFGKTVFLTKNEAKAKLKELRGAE